MIEITSATGSGDQATSSAIDLPDGIRNLRRKLSPGSEAMRMLLEQPFGHEVIESGVLRTPNSNVVFKHVEKIGCTSVKRALINHMYPGALDLPVEKYHHGQHATTFDIIHNISHEVLRMVVSENILEHCVWVTFCRNPYDRLKSCYRDKVVGTRASEREYTNYIRREILFSEMRNSTYRRENFNADGIPSFQSFIRFACNPASPSDIHWRPQLLLNAADLASNLKLVRFENFSQDLERIFSRDLGIETQFSKRDNSTESKTESHQLELNEELAQLIFEFYRCDFEFFDYQKDSWKSS
ncbi:hypothetical protein DF165_05155 [Burkholderia cenocepacia]|nr:hypothetical protein DF165_05155 [Burkholderia cenocepacia]